MSDEIKNNQPVDEVEKLKVQAEEYLDNWKRERADFINYKKDEAKRVGEFVRFANEGLILELIDVLDNLELGLKHESTELLIRLSKDFEDLLKKYGVERIKVEGESFNPMFHEAVEGVQGSTLEEVRPGYLMDGKVLRPARVKIVE